MLDRLRLLRDRENSDVAPSMNADPCSAICTANKRDNSDIYIGDKRGPLK